MHDEALPHDGASQQESAEERLLHIEVIYALPNEQRIFKTIVIPEMVITDIIVHSGILDIYPEIDLTMNKVGVFGRQRKLDSLVHDGDRIEIYRPLTADPKEIRRQRVEKSRQEAK